MSPARAQIESKPGVLIRRCYSCPDDNLFKRVVIASGYVDFNYIKEKTSQPEDSKVEPGDGTKVEL